MQDLGNTQYFKVETEPETGVKLVLATVYEALTENGEKAVTNTVVRGTVEGFVNDEILLMPTIR